MQFLPFALAALMSVVSLHTQGQDINWAALQPGQLHFIHTRAGFENGVVFGAGYHYRFSSKLPILIGAEYAFPAGKQLADDFNTRMGLQTQLLQAGPFKLGAKVQGLYRQYQNKLVQLKNFGCYLEGTIGFYQRHWFVAGQFGFDKAIVTHFTHSARYREIYPGARNGWYEPDTGGNYNYGLVLGYYFKRSGLTLRAGKLTAQDFKTDPFVPIYAHIGYLYRIGK